MRYDDNTCKNFWDIQRQIWQTMKEKKEGWIVKLAELIEQQRECLYPTK